MKDPFKHKDSMRKMLLEDKWRFSGGRRAKKIRPYRNDVAPSEEMGGVPNERPEKNAQGDDLPWWINK